MSTSAVEALYSVDLKFSCNFVNPPYFSDFSSLAVEAEVSRNCLRPVTDTHKFINVSDVALFGGRLLCGSTSIGLI